VSLALGVLSVGEGYFETLGVQMMLGSGGRRGEAAVTPELADALWPDESSIGQVVRFVGKTLEVKGVADIPFGSLRWGRMPVLIAFEADADLDENMRVLKRVSFVARTSDADAAKVALRRLAVAAFPNAASVRIERGTDLVAAQLGNERMGAFFFSGFSVVAIGLALVGTIGLVAQTLRTRERDLAIRAALGAGRVDLIRATASPTLLPVMLGGVSGFVLSFWSSALIRGVILDLVPDKSFEAAVAVAGTALMASLVIISGAFAIRGPLRRPSAILKGDAL
jgi:putative ABC transport system permease protein